MIERADDTELLAFCCRVLDRECGFLVTFVCNVCLEVVGERFVRAYVDVFDTIIILQFRENLIDNGRLTDRKEHLGTVASNRPQSCGVAASKNDCVHIPGHSTRK